MPKPNFQNYSDYRNKLLQDWFLVLFFILMIFFISYAIGLYDIVTNFLKAINVGWLDDLLIALIFSFIPFFIFALRRQSDLVEEIKNRNEIQNEYRNYVNQVRKVFEALDDVVLQTDENLRVVWANTSALEQFNKPIGATINKFMFGDEENLPKDSYIIKAFEKGSIEREIKFFPANSEREKDKYLEQIAIPFKNKKGEIIGITSISRDITEKIEFEESKSRLASIVESSEDAIFVVSPDGSIHSWNKSAENIFGYKASQVVGQQITILDHIIDFETLIKIPQLDLSFSSGKKILHVDMVAVRRGDETIYVNLTVYPFVDERGQVLGFTTIARDITNSIKAEEALRESEERYRTFVTNFKGIAYRWSPDYHPIFMHGNVEEITGYDVDDFLSNKVHWDNIVLKEDRQIVQQNREFIRKNPNKSIEFEYRIINKNGDICWLNESLLNVTNEKNEIIYIQATIYDITQRKIAETELRESRQQLRNLALHLDSVREEERKQIAFEIHDELGYALTAIKLDIAWLVKKIDVSRDNLEQKIREMSDLLELTIQKVRTISSQLRPSILDHFGLVAAIDWQSKEFQRRTAIRTRFFVNPRDLTVPENLATPIFRIFQESLTNISRYAKASRVDVSLEIIDSNLVLKVVDNGLGIEPEKIHHKNSFGLLGMREKAKSMGGELVISNLKYKNNGYQNNGEVQGTEVILSVPIKFEVKND